jgi:microcystin-dependent protein
MQRAAPAYQPEPGALFSVILGAGQIPAHTHNANGSSAPVSGSTGSGTPSTSVLPGTFSDNYYSTSSTTAFGSNAVSYTDNQSHENRQPFLALNFCVALVGVYPPHS